MHKHDHGPLGKLPYDLMREMYGYIADYPTRDDFEDFIKGLTNKINWIDYMRHDS
jgi:hypothetical protein